ncbi:hypothetical protein Pelo_17319 [Pelomyxa schiedti]|nr:hypothetical protein Pelo_17319 [Pelomyxa schiedti]
MFTQSTCCACGRKAFPIESVAVNSKTYHKACFLCSTCKISLSPSNHHLVAGKLFCQVHRPTAVTSTTAAIRSSPADTRSVASTATTPPVLGPAETVTYKTSTATVNISTLQTPWSVLGVTPGTPIKQLKDAFYKLINVESRQTRAIVSLSYYILLNVDLPSSKFSVSGCQAICRDTGDIWFLCAIGHTAKLREKLTQNPKQLLATDGHGCTLLYVAARGGFYDTTEMLLKLKAHVNTTQHTKSSALHCAAYYGHEPVVELLLSYGIQDTINTFGNTAAAEARTQRIKCLITKYNVDASAQTIASITRGISNCISHVAHKGEVVGLSLRVANTIEKMKWKTAWHGTKMKYTASILQNGLVASGDKLPNGKAVKPPSNHFALNTRINGIDNWAHPIYHLCMSSVLFRACHVQ